MRAGQSGFGYWEREARTDPNGTKCVVSLGINKIRLKCHLTNIVNDQDIISLFQTTAQRLFSFCKILSLRYTCIRG